MIWNSWIVYKVILFNYIVSIETFFISYVLIKKIALWNYSELSRVSQNNTIKIIRVFFLNLLRYLPQLPLFPSVHLSLVSAKNCFDRKQFSIFYPLRSSTNFASSFFASSVVPSSSPKSLKRLAEVASISARTWVNSCATSDKGTTSSSSKVST